MKKILIIDDERDFCLFVKLNFELDSDYEVIIAVDGKEGLLAAQKEEPDLILLDLSMPGISGQEVLKRLKENSKTRSIPVLILTAMDNKELKSKISESSVSDFIVKPCRIECLRARIEGLEKNV